MYKGVCEKPVNYALYKSILKSIFIKIWHYVLKESWVFQPPLKFGQFYIAESFTSKGTYINWAESKKKGKLVKKYNLHSSGKKFFTKWSKILCRVVNSKFYTFSPYRGSAEEFTGKRGLAYWINKCSTDPYLEDFKGHII